MSLPNFKTLRDLHNSANNLLQRALVDDHQQERWVHEVSEASLRMLEVCGTTKDVLLLVKDHLQDLHSTFRRVSIGESATETKFEAHSLYRKKLKKEMLMCLRSLKRMNKKCITTSSNNVSPIDQNLVVVVDVLREVRVTTMSIVESLMSLMSMPKPTRNPNKGSFTSKLKRANSLILWKKSDMSMLQTANKRLETVSIAIEDLEVELECMFRRLIQTRVSLLNILTN